MGAKACESIAPRIQYLDTDRGKRTASHYSCIMPGNRGNHMTEKSTGAMEFIVERVYLSLLELKPFVLAITRQNCLCA
jgi:hypothetical protein